MFYFFPEKIKSHNLLAEATSSTDTYPLLISILFLDKLPLKSFFFLIQTWPEKQQSNFLKP